MPMSCIRPVMALSFIASVSAMPLPPVLVDPYAGAEDPIIAAQGFPQTNDPWGVYTGTAFCHGLCHIEGMCEEVTKKDLLVIESPVTISITGDLDEGGIVLNGFVNINWQEVKKGNSSFAGLFDTSYLPMTVGKMGLGPNNHSSWFFSGKEGSLGQTTGALQVYAQNLLPSDITAGDPWGWVFASFANEPLTYSSAYGEASLKGRLYARNYSPSSKYTGICNLALSRNMKMTYQPNKPSLQKQQAHAISV